MQKGWVKLHRKIQDHWIYQEKRQFSRYEAWLDLIMMANHKDNKTLVDGELITIEKGSFITSKRELGRRWEWSNSKVDKFLELLKSDEMIVYKSDTKKTVITIGKYEVYHDSEKEKRHENETETNQKHIENESETNKQECKEFKALEELKELSTTTSTTLALDQGYGEVVQTFEANLCMLSPMQRESLGMWFDDFNQQPEIIYLAIKIAADRNKKNFGFVEYLLKEWSNHKLTTVEQIESYERNGLDRQRKQARPYARTGAKVERIPEWFNQQQNQQQEAEPKANPDIEAKRKELEQKLESMRRQNA
ncbi:DnaD domain-containing protein [Sporosarcina koreensis]|uniref:DnaD domain-containing protein n=1 Tax=Sporosarcina koreensis TaxID=334735 RepID=UPI00075DED7B|nr:DnaD domain protein [Sporosarcina koreensis]